MKYDLNEKLPLAVSGSNELVNRKFGGRITIRIFFEPVTNRPGIGYLLVTGWM